MASQGPNSTGTASNDAAVGVIAWATPTNAQASDNSETTCSNNSANTTRVGNYLKSQNFGFAIPAGATIDGIVVEIEKRVTGTGASCRDSAVRIVKADGSIGTTDKGDTVTAWTTSTNLYTTYGGPADLWGEAWTPADINDADFGVVISPSVTMGPTFTAVSRIDHVRITVHYTAGVGGTAVKDMVMTGIIPFAR